MEDPGHDSPTPETKPLRTDFADMEPLLQEFRPRLRELLSVRMDRRLRGRIDPSDVIQETYAEVAQRFPEYASRLEVPFYVWIRFLAIQQLAAHHRKHLGTQARDPGRERPVEVDSDREPSNGVASEGRNLLAMMIREEMRNRLREVLATLDPRDQKILHLRHFEQLSNQEAARVMNIKPTAACNRYVRALERLRDALRSISDQTTDWSP